MQILLHRIAKRPTYTIGKLYISGKYFCDTIEDRDRGLKDTLPLDTIKAIKVYGETAIPTGTYTINMNTVSPRLKNKAWAKQYNGIVPRILNVKGFEGVLIHPGNTAKDSLGCIVVGENKEVGKVINSQKTWKKLMEVLVKEKTVITLTII